VDARGLRGGWADFQTLWSGPPAPALVPFVARYWSATWDLRAQDPYPQKIVPLPHVHLTVVDGLAPTVTGVARRHTTRVLAGAGHVFGMAFRPGGFRPFYDRAVSSLTDRVVPARDIFGPELPADPQELEAFLCTRVPPLDGAAAEVSAIVESVEASPDVLRVDALAGRFGLSVRQLQRLFKEYVGVGPKWVIRRYRLREVTERLEHGTAVDWAGLAADLGYADQPHFVHDFTVMFGEPPTRYAMRYPDGRNGS
jgi:AraC-like DNA-binding protein